MALPKTPLLQLPENAVEEIKKLYNLEKPGRMDESVEILYSWIQKQNHFLKKDYSKDYLERVVMTCKGSVEKAKKQIDRLSTMRSLLPKFFTVTNVKSDLKDVLDVVKLVPLPVVTKEYYRAMLVKIIDKNLTADKILMYFQYSIIREKDLCERLVSVPGEACMTDYQPLLPVDNWLSEYIRANDLFTGVIIIEDLRGFNFVELLTKLDTTELQQFVSILVEGYGARMKGIHILTESKAIDFFVKTIKHFLSEKIGNRIHVHNTIEELHRMVPKDILPKEYGGKQKAFNELIDDWVEQLSTPEVQKYMEMMNKAGTNETLRSSCKFNEEYMGMPGSFRNISVD